MKQTAIKQSANIWISLFLLTSIGTCLAGTKTLLIGEESKFINNKDLYSYEDLYKKQVVVDVENYKPGVDRLEFLVSLFNRVTFGLESDEEKILAVLKHVQLAIYDTFKTPIDTTGQAIYDPLVLYEIGLGQCGQSNRVLVDLLYFNGIKSRLLQLNGHVAAMVFYDGAWRYIDAHTFTKGQYIKGLDGKLVKLQELFKNPELVHNVAANVENHNIKFKFGVESEIDVLGDLKIFTRKRYSLITPYYYERVGGREQLKNKYFGWNYYREVEFNLY